MTIALAASATVNLALLATVGRHHWRRRRVRAHMNRLFADAEAQPPRMTED